MFRAGSRGQAWAFNLTAAVGAGMNPVEITSSTRKKSSGKGTGIVCIFEKYLWWNFVKKQRIIFFVISFIAIGYVWIFAQSEKIQCTPNLDENAIVIRSKNMCISNVTTKFGNLALSSMDYRSCHLNIVEYGTEYVRIDYTNKQKQQKFTVFEIVVSPYNLVVISQFDEVGNQINFSTYWDKRPGYLSTAIFNADTISNDHSPSL